MDQMFSREALPKRGGVYLSTKNWLQITNLGCMTYLLNSFFKLSGKLDLPAYPGFMVMNIAMSVLTLTCFPTSSICIGASASERGS